MAQIAYNPKFQAFSTAGVPLVGGKLYTYSAGTTTPKTTWSDSGEVTPNANPIILDSRGEATIYGNGSYKWVLKDSSNSTLWTVDNIAIGGTVVTADIADGAVTTPKLATGVLSADTDGRAKMADSFVTSAKLNSSGVTLPNGSLATTQSAADNSTKVATTAYADAVVSGAIASQADQETGTSTTKLVTSGRQKFHPSSPKAWASFSLTGATASIIASYGITSITWTATGTAAVVFSTNMSSSSYCVVAHANNNATGTYMSVNLGSYATTGFTFYSQNVGGSALGDAAYCSFMVFGDQ